MGLSVETRPCVSSIESGLGWYSVSDGVDQQRVGELCSVAEGLMCEFPDNCAVLFTPPVTRRMGAYPHTTDVVVVCKLGDYLEIHSRKVEPDVLLGDPTDWILSVGTPDELIPLENVPNNPWEAMALGDGQAAARTGTGPRLVYSPSVAFYNDDAWKAVLQKGVYPYLGALNGFLSTAKTHLKRRYYRTTEVSLLPLTNST